MIVSICQCINEYYYYCVLEVSILASFYDFFYQILELFWQCDIFFLFYYSLYSWISQISADGSVLVSSEIDCWFEPLSGQTKYYTTGTCNCYFSAALRSKSKDWLTMSQDNVWSDMSARILLFRWGSTIEIKLSVLVSYKTGIIIISSNVTCSRHDMAENCWSLTHSFTRNCQIVPDY